MDKQLAKLMNLSAKELDGPVEIFPHLYWVGHKLDDDFQCHTYLLVNGKDSVLFDPGSKLTFGETFRKIEEVIPFSHIRYFVCHHQDPDITGALADIDAIVTRNDARILSHWRAITILKHLGLKLPMECVEKMGWCLDLGRFHLDFIFSPYLHFPGAFVSYIREYKALLSSDIFGGLTPEFQLVAEDETCYEGIRLFHEHYMPSRDILMNFLLKLEQYDIEVILPQHGSIIPERLIPFIINRLKEIDCGIYTLTQTSSDIVKLSRLNHLLADITKTIILNSNFNRLVDQMMKKAEKLLNISDMVFVAKNDHDEPVLLGRDRFNVTPAVDEQEFCFSLIQKDRTYWLNRYGRLALELKTIHPHPSSIKKNLWIAPLFDLDEENNIGIIQATVKEGIVLDHDALNTIDRIIPALSAALEREMIRVQLDREKNEFYQISIKDPLTGLYTRYYMQEMVSRFCNLQDRDSSYKVGVFYFDIDDFKHVNDTFGHGVGDIVLKEVARVILEETREEDIQVRLGGEELGVIFLTKDWENCHLLAERIREKISSLDFSQWMGVLRVTVSGGIAFREPKESMDHVLETADSRLYKAKQSGKNRIVTD